MRLEPETYNILCEGFVTKKGRRMWIPDKLAPESQTEAALNKLLPKGAIPVRTPAAGAIIKYPSHTFYRVQPNGSMVRIFPRYERG